MPASRKMHVLRSSSGVCQTLAHVKVRTAKKKADENLFCYLHFPNGDENLLGYHKIEDYASQNRERWKMIREWAVLPVHIVVER